MFKNKYAEKLINAIAYFAKNVSDPTQVKIFKLLFFLDFMHFKKTGKPVTGLLYYAWPFGPVPKELWIRIKNNDLPEEIIAAIAFQKEQTEQGFEKTLFRAKLQPNLALFSPIQQKMMQDLVFMYKSIKPFQISEITHLKNSPWDKTRKQKGDNAEIDYLLAVDSDAEIDMEDAKASLADFQEFQKHYHLEPL